VIREYVGRGPLAEEAAALDAERRAERRARAEDWRVERESLDALEDRVAEVDQAAESVARTALMLADFARHHRSEWRRRRG
jgi:hypothetical protein